MEIVIWTFLILGLILLLWLFFWFLSENSTKKNLSKKKKVKDEPALNEIEKEMSEINQRVYESGIKSLENDKDRYISEVEYYCRLGYIDEIQKERCLIKFKEQYEKNLIKHKENPHGIGNPMHNFFPSLFHELQGIKKECYLSGTYGKDVARKLAFQEVWLGMSRAELEESRGEPSAIEKVVSKDGEIEKFVYGHKKLASNFTLKNGKVIKIIDRDDYTNDEGEASKIFRCGESMF